MHAVVVRSTIEDFESARRMLREDVVPRVSQAPGFVAAYWVKFEGSQGGSMLVFESEEAARTMADQVVATAPVEIESVDVGEVVEHA